MLHEQPRLYDLFHADGFARQLQQRAAFSGKLPEQRINERPEGHSRRHREAGQADHRLARYLRGHRRTPRFHAHAAEEDLAELLEYLYRVVAPSLRRTRADKHEIVFRRAFFNIFFKYLRHVGKYRRDVYFKAPPPK